MERDLQPSVSASKPTLRTQDKASGRLSAPDRLTNGHEPLIEDWKIVMLPVSVRILNTRGNQCLGQEKVPAAKEKKECKETQKHTQESTHVHTHTQLKISSRNPCFFFNSLFLFMLLSLTWAIYIYCVTLMAEPLFAVFFVSVLYFSVCCNKSLIWIELWVLNNW